MNFRGAVTKREGGKGGCVHRQKLMTEGAVLPYPPLNYHHQLTTEQLIVIIIRLEDS